MRVNSHCGDGVFNGPRISTMRGDVLENLNRDAVR
jgi:hypothetical protein